MVRWTRETCPGKTGQSHRQERKGEESTEGHIGGPEGPEMTFPISRIGCPHQHVASILRLAGLFGLAL